MKIEGSSDIPAPRQKVWAALLDPARLATAMADEYRAILKIGGR